MTRAFYAVGAPQTQPRPPFPSGAGAATFVVGAAVLCAGVGIGVTVTPRITVLVVVAVVTTVIVATSRPPLELLLPLVPATVPLGALTELQFEGRTMPLVWADVATLLVVLAWLANPGAPPRRWLLWLVALIAWSAATILVAHDQREAIAALKVVVQAAILGLIAASTAARRAVKTLLAVSWGVLFMGVVIACRLFFQGAGSSRAALTSAAVSKIGSDLNFGRSNYLATLIVLSLLAALVLWRHLQTNRPRLFVIAALPALLFGLLASGSKTQVLSVGFLFVAVLVVSFYESARSQRLSLRMLVGCVILVPLGMFAWPIVQLMFQQVHAYGGIGQYRTVEQRRAIWEAGFAAVQNHLVAGVGLQNLTLPNGEYTMAHNTLLQVAAETGIVGLALFLAAVGGALVGHRGTYRATALLVAVTLIVSGLAENTLRTREYDFVAWLLLGALVAVRTAKSNHASNGT